MMRELIFLFSVASISTFAGNVKLLVSLPGGAVSQAMQLDAAGNIYLTGSVTPQNPKDAQDTSDIFLAKVSADGSTVLYFTSLGGSFAKRGNRSPSLRMARPTSRARPVHPISGDRRSVRNRVRHGGRVARVSRQG